MVVLPPRHLMLCFSNRLLQLVTLQSLELVLALEPGNPLLLQPVFELLNFGFSDRQPVTRPDRRWQRPHCAPVLALCVAAGTICDAVRVSRFGVRTRVRACMRSRLGSNARARVRSLGARLRAGLGACIRATSRAGISSPSVPPIVSVAKQRTALQVVLLHRELLLLLDRIKALILFGNALLPEGRALHVIQLGGAHVVDAFRRG
mmetsp:Transcript_18442/g.47499  ORF Transcript_18442/g.47499 Transcript_18442/m.47499 type:complete len:205 (+) Transcript_18442:130-744(+)